MPKPYSTDLRERAVEAVESGASRREVAEVFEVGVSSVIRWCRRRSETGSVEAKPSGGSTSPLEEHSEWLLALVAKQPDLTLKEILAAMAKQGIGGSQSALQRFFDRHNVSFKKKVCTRRSKSEPMSLAPADAGYESKACLIPPGWCLLTRPPLAQTWCGSGAAARAASDWSHRSHTDIGKRSPLLLVCGTTGSSPHSCSMER